jgi:tetratricopeptide (TPR) repeat protein
LIGLALAATPADSQLSDAELLQQAQAAFHQGVQARDHADEARPHFRAAAACYEQLRQRGASNDDLYRNQGNAYLLGGDLPRAILAYRRGLRQSPNERRLQAHLAYAREQVAYPVSGSFGRPPVDRYPPWLPRLAPVWLLLTAIVSYSLTWVALTRWWMLRHGRPLGLALMAGVATAALVTGLAVETVGRHYEAQHPLLVIDRDGVRLRRGNGQSYPPSYETPLNRGVEARLLFQRGKWYQIELAGGEVGWVPASSALLGEAD